MLFKKSRHCIEDYSGNNFNMINCKSVTTLIYQQKQA